MKGSSVILREPSLKKCFMQMGNKFGLSPDLIKMLYNYKRKVENEEVESVRLFHKNMILFQCLDTCGNLLKTNYIQSWKGKYDQHIKSGKCYMKNDIFNHLLPDKRGIEWAIQNSRLVKRHQGVGPHVLGYFDTRGQYALEINILGEENYIFMKRPIDGGYEITPCPLNKKILYLNTSSWNEITEDYGNYLNWKGTGHEMAWRILVDDYGDSSFI